MRPRAKLRVLEALTDGRKVIVVGDLPQPQVLAVEEAIGEEIQIRLHPYLVGEVAEVEEISVGIGTDVYHRHGGVIRHLQEAVGAIDGVAGSTDVLDLDQDHVAPFLADETRHDMINPSALPLVSYCTNRCNRAARDVCVANI